MGVRQVLLAVGVLVGSSGAARAEDVLLNGLQVRSAEECLEVMAKFGWYCAHFEDNFWQQVYGNTYWNLTVNHPTPVYFTDADEDGIEDVIVAQVWGCGVRGCSHQLLFGSQADEPGYFGISVSSDGPVFKTDCDDGPGVRFGEGTYCFSAKFIKSHKWVKLKKSGEE